MSFFLRSVYLNLQAKQLEGHINVQRAYGAVWGLCQVKSESHLILVNIFTVWDKKRSDICIYMLCSYLHGDYVTVQAWDEL